MKSKLKQFLTNRKVIAALLTLGVVGGATAGIETGSIDVDALAAILSAIFAEAPAAP